MDKSKKNFLLFEVKQEFVIGTRLLLLALVVLAALSVPFVPFILEQFDGEKQHQAIGIVTKYDNESVSATRLSLCPVTIQIGDKQVTSMTLLPAAVGERVTVTYTIGRSGTYYIDRFEPVPSVQHS